MIGTAISWELNNLESQIKFDSEITQVNIQVEHYEPLESNIRSRC